MNLKHLANLQKWNKYAYVLNNPLTLVDPDGLEETWVQFRVFSLSRMLDTLGNAMVEV